MDSLTLFGHLFKTRCEAICIFLDFFTEKRGSHREIYNFFRKNHEMHCICKRFSIYCNKNCSGNMQILCPFAETTYAPSGDENFPNVTIHIGRDGNNLRPVRGRKHFCETPKSVQLSETTYAPSGDENVLTLHILHSGRGNNLRPVRGRKPNRSPRNRLCFWKQLTPRQGTKTQRATANIPAHQKQLTPRQGTKTAMAAT